MQKIRVGLLGVGEWARYGHLPALASLPQFEVTAVASRSLEKAQELSSQLGIRHGLGSAEELSQHPEVDLVAVLNQAPQHYSAALLALKSGKQVYCEWPLTNRLDQTEHLEQVARQSGQATLVGLQRRFAPSVRYLQSLLQEGYLGELRSVRMHASEGMFQSIRHDTLGFTAPTQNFSSPFSIYGGHFLDLLIQIVGPIDRFQAVTLNQFPEVSLRPSGTVIATSAIDQFMLLARLRNGAPVTFHVEGGKRSGFGVQLDLTGSRGDLRLSNDCSFHSPRDHKLEGSQECGQPLQEMAVPARYRSLESDDLDATVQDLAYLYSAFSQGAPTPDFGEALRLHQLLAEIQELGQD